MEWEDKNKYNSFNSFKGLTYMEQYRATERWLKGKEDIYNLPPIEVSLDPIMKCNLNCYYCNSQRYLKEERDKTPIMSKKYMQEFIDFLAKWGVRGVCLGGGGESMLNQDAHYLPSYIASKGMECSIVTNGTIMNNSIARQMLYCRWVGFSLDACDPKTYESIKGVDMFDKVVANIETLTKARAEENSRVDVSIKFLILPENYRQILETCVLAKNLGVQDFHVRPVDFERQDYKGRPHEYTEEDLKLIRKQSERCHTLEDDNFHVYTVSHKFSPDLKVVHKFKGCWTSPLVLQACADGNAYLCVDHRMEDRFKLGSADPKSILHWWGRNEHKEKILSVRPDKECARCTWCEYNRQYEETLREDKMCLAFP